MIPGDRIQELFKYMGIIRSSASFVNLDQAVSHVENIFKECYSISFQPFRESVRVFLSGETPAFKANEIFNYTYLKINLKTENIKKNLNDFVNKDLFKQELGNLRTKSGAQMYFLFQIEYTKIVVIAFDYFSAMIKIIESRLEQFLTLSLIEISDFDFLFAPRGRKILEFQDQVEMMFAQFLTETETESLEEFQVL